jgi:hypothetical protein
MEAKCTHGNHVDHAQRAEHSVVYHGALQQHYVVICIKASRVNYKFACAKANASKSLHKSLMSELQNTQYASVTVI